MIRRRIVGFGAAALLVLALFAPPAVIDAGAQSAEDEIRAATKRLYEALDKALGGDLDALSALWSHGADATDFGPLGGRALGWQAVRADYQRRARLYSGGKLTPTEVRVSVAGDMGYSVCLERREVRATDGASITATDRATNIFRREDGEWKLVHRHTDPLPQIQPESARR